MGEGIEERQRTEKASCHENSCESSVWQVLIRGLWGGANLGLLGVLAGGVLWPAYSDWVLCGLIAVVWTVTAVVIHDGLRWSGLLALCTGLTWGSALTVVVAISLESWSLPRYHWLMAIAVCLFVPPVHAVTVGALYSLGKVSLHPVVMGTAPIVLVGLILVLSGALTESEKVVAESLRPFYDRDRGAEVKPAPAPGWQ